MDDEHALDLSRVAFEMNRDRRKLVKAFGEAAARRDGEAMGHAMEALAAVNAILCDAYAQMGLPSPV